MKSVFRKTRIAPILLLLSVLYLFHSCDPINTDKPPVLVDSLGTSISSVEFASYKDACLVIVRTNESWTATASANWISLSANSGKGNTAFLIGSNENQEFKREGKVTINTGKKSKEIKIVQDGTSRMVLNILGINIALRKIEGGVFTMSGSDNISYYGVAHQVTLSDFYIMETEVTNQLWKTVMKTLPYDTIPEFTGHSQHLKPFQAVSATNWNDVNGKFLTAFNQITAKTFKLPTEAQWEYAACGGKYYQGKKYAGSDKLDDVAWYYSNSGGEKHDVGDKNPNELGLYDMSGNVSEWCSDWYDQNFGFPIQNNTLIVPANQNDPIGPSTGTKKVVRGGSYVSELMFSTDCNVKDRRSIKPNGYDMYEGNPRVFFMCKNTGFRLVVTQ